MNQLGIGDKKMKYRGNHARIVSPNTARCCKTKSGIMFLNNIVGSRFSNGGHVLRLTPSWTSKLPVIYKRLIRLRIKNSFKRMRPVVTREDSTSLRSTNELLKQSFQKSKDQFTWIHPKVATIKIVRHMDV